MTLTMPECKYTIHTTPVWLLVASVYKSKSVPKRAGSFEKILDL